MQFMCSNCQYDHDIQKDSYTVDPRGGTLAGGGWFRDERGINHQALACLRCGTIHATTGAPLKALFSLFSRSLSVKYYLTIEKLQELMERIAQQDSLSLAEALGTTGLPDIVLDALVARGYLSFIEKDVTQQSAKVEEVSDESPMSEEGIQNLCFAFAQKYIMFCMIFDKEPMQASSLREFMDDSLERGEDSESFQAVVVIHYAIDNGFLEKEQLLATIGYAAELADDIGYRDKIHSAFE